MTDVFANLLLVVIRLFLIAILGHVILSWLIVAGVRNEIVLRLYQGCTVISEPIMGPIRRVMPRFGMIDITPMVTILLLTFIERVISSTI